jgi:hypothetical protein
MAEAPKKKYKNLREAYCGARRVRPQRFERSVFWKALLPHAVIPTFFSFWWFERSLFQRDLEAIRSIGSARNERELDAAIEEYDNLNALERSVRRSILGFRVTGKRLYNIFVPLLDLVELPDAPLEMDYKIRQNSSMDSRDGGAAALRRLRRIHSEVVAGKELKQVLAELGASREEFRADLERYHANRPDLAWFWTYLTHEEELEALRQENNRLTKLTADLSSRLLNPK